MVGVRGEVGNRLFLLQARQGRRLYRQVREAPARAPSPSGSRQVIDDLGRPGHLPDDLALEPEYESDFVAGDIAVALDEDAKTIEVTFESVEEDDDARV